MSFSKISIREHTIMSSEGLDSAKSNEGLDSARSSEDLDSARLNIEATLDTILTNPEKIMYSLGVHALESTEQELVINHFMTNVYPKLYTLIVPELLKMPVFIMSAAVKLIQEIIYCKYHTLDWDRRYHAYIDVQFKTKIRPFLAEGLIANSPCCGCSNMTMSHSHGACTDAICSSCNLRVEVKSSCGDIYSNFNGGRVEGVDYHHKNNGAFCFFTKNGSGFAKPGDWSFQKKAPVQVNGSWKTNTTIRATSVTPFSESFKKSIDDISETDKISFTKALHITFDVLHHDNCEGLIGSDSVYDTLRGNPIPFRDFDIIREEVGVSFDEFQQMIKSKLPQEPLPQESLPQEPLRKWGSNDYRQGKVCNAASNDFKSAHRNGYQEDNRFKSGGYNGSNSARGSGYQEDNRFKSGGYNGSNSARGSGYQASNGFMSNGYKASNGFMSNGYNGSNSVRGSVSNSEIPKKKLNPFGDATPVNTNEGSNSATKSNSKWERGK